MNHPILEPGWVMEGRNSDGSSLRLLIADSLLQRHYPGVSVGRHPALCELVIEEPSISHRHFRLSREGHHLMVEDLNSLNGTRLSSPAETANGQPADLDPFRPTPLAPGESLMVGRITLTLRRVDS